jgi:hypothetical protein
MRRCALGWSLLALSLFPALVSAGEDTLPPPGLAPATVQNNLVFRRQDGSIIQFRPGTHSWVWCGPWEEGSVDTPTLHILTADPSGPPYWRLDAVLADITLGEPLLFPNSWIWPNPDDVEIFVWDPPNELSTQTGGSGGSIVFQSLGCGPSDEVQFSIDATIGSEFGDGTHITVQGDFRATISGPPVPTQPLTWGRVKGTYR